MGVVYRAHDTVLDRDVAVKALPLGPLGDRSRQARFVREARAASALSHPNIASVHDIVVDDSGAYIVMELVDGSPLSVLLRQGPLPVARAIKLAAQIADALAAAHEVGTVHRDLKPSNVLVTRDDVVKVVDFGLATHVERPSNAGGEEPTTVLTPANAIVGTPQYMSPEQARGETVDGRSDIFNLGLVLHEMLSGARAFTGATVHELLTAILRDEPAPLPPQVPGVLRQIVATCLEKHPAHRFDSARDVGIAVRLLLADAGESRRDVEAGPAPMWMRRRVAFASAVVAPALVAATLLVVHAIPGPTPIDLSKYSLTPFAIEGTIEENPVWSPDGRSIAYRERGMDVGSRLMWRSLEAATATPLTAPSVIASEVCGWTPDGTRVLFLADGALWSVVITGSEPERILPPIVRAAAISPDGRTIVHWGPAPGDSTETLWSSSVAGADLCPYEPAPFRTVQVTRPYVAFSPDGHRILLSRKGRDGRWAFWRMPWPANPRDPPRRLAELADAIGSLTFSWMPDSRHFVFTQFTKGELFMADVESGRSRQISAGNDGYYWAPSVSPDGRRIATEIGKNDFDIVEFPLDGGEPVAVMASTRSELSPTWSAASDRMAYIQGGEVRVRSGDGVWSRRVVSARDFDGSAPIFYSAGISPDGQRVAYSCDGDGTGAKIWISPVAGGSPVRASTAGAGVRESRFSWSPTGEELVVLVEGDPHRSLKILRPGTQVSTSIPESDGWPVSVPVWSPDGRWIAVGNHADQTIVLLSPDGTERRAFACPTRVSDNVFLLVWSQDVHRLLLLGTPDFRISQLYEIDPSKGGSRRIGDYDSRRLGWRLATFLPDYAFGASLTADGLRIATTAIVERCDVVLFEGFPQPARPLWWRFW
jgi:Tol biopolymer transport system component